MNIKRFAMLATAPALAIGIMAAGLSLATAPYSGEGVAVETPTASAPFTLPPVLTVATSEDDPGWNCQTQGNRICGLTHPAMIEAAWETWDANGGAAQLLVNPNSRVSLAGYSLMTPYDPDGPDLGIHQLALPGAEVWFIYEASPLN